MSDTPEALKVLAAIQSFASNTLRTDSRDLFDWKEDMAFVEKFAQERLAALRQATQPAGTVPIDVKEAAHYFVSNGYRGPLPRARLVFDWVDSQTVAPHPEAPPQASERAEAPARPSVEGGEVAAQPAGCEHE